nr:hypothetical protein [Gemmatimonadota bacterium]
MLVTALLACGSPAPSGSRTAWLPDVDHPVWVDEEVLGLATAWRFEGLLPAADVARVTCTLDTDPEEVHTIEAPADRLPDLVLYGLLAASTYTCVLAAGGEQETRTIET